MRNAWRVLRYARPYGRRLVLILVITALVAGIELLRPWPMKVLVDNVLGDEPVPGALAAIARALPGPEDDGLLVLVVAGGLLIYLAGALLSMALTVTAVAVGRRMTYDLAADVFAHYQRLSLRFHARRSVGDSLTRVVGDSYCPEVLVSSALVPVLEAVLTLVGMLVVMWLLSPELTLLSLAVVPFLFLVIKGFAKPMRDRSRAALDLQGRMASVVEETLTAVPAVQAFTREGVETERFRAYAGRTLAAELRSTVTDMRFRLFAGLVTAVGTAALVFAGARLAQDGTVTVGTILVFLGYLAALYAPLDSLTYSASNVQQATAQADRVMEVLDTAPEVADPPHARPRRLRGGVRFEGVTFGYEPGQPVLHDVSLEVQPGGTVAIVGPTGAGKSTLVSFLVRFNDPWSGRVLIGGEDVREMRLRSLREQVALVLQEPFIFPMTVAENIAYGRVDADRDAVVAAAQAANAHEFIARLPQGYDTVVGQRGATLSGGEKQRLSIARAFLKDAPILVLDEPTSALDARTEGLLLDALARLMRERITFVVAHRLSTIHNADQILVLDEGRIVERGPHAELVAAGGLYARLYRQQGQFAQHELVSGEPR